MSDIGIWTVHFTLPKTEARRYVYNEECTVVSDTLPNALVVLLNKYPDAVVHDANKRGRGELLVDPRVGLVEGVTMVVKPL